MSLFEPRVTQTLMVIPVIHHFPLQIAMLRHHPTLAFAIFGCFNHVLSPHFRSFRSACVPFVLEKPAICWGPGALAMPRSRHYKDIAQPDVNEKVYDEITKISAALKQLKVGLDSAGFP
jgi:hypothetical protein